MPYHLMPNTAMTTLDKVFERVEEFSRNYTDRFVEVKDISFEDLETINIDNNPHYMRPIAQQEIAFRLGIPIQYLRKCPPEVQAYNMNHWIEKERNEELFLRFDGGEVRAIFTPRYKPVDNMDVLKRLDSIGYSPDTRVQCYLDSEFMLLNIPDSSKAFSINGDSMTPGISISNSEVGIASLTIAAYVLRLVCTNGLISTEGVSASYRHISKKLLEELPKVLNSVSGELTRQKSKIKMSIESSVENPLSTIERLNRQFQLNNLEKEAIEWAWPLEEGDTMFNVINAYTRAAQYNRLPAESSYRLQKTAGTVLNMLSLQPRQTLHVSLAN